MSEQFHYVLVAVLTFFSTSILGWYVFKKGPRKTLNRSYGFWAFCVAAWSFFLALSVISQSYYLALLSSRALHLVATILPVVYLQFVLNFISGHTKGEERKILLFFCGVMGCTLIALPTPWLVDVAWKSSFGFFVSVPKTLYILHLFTFIGCVSVATYKLLRAFLSSSGTKRKQLQYFLLATMIGYSGGVTNYLINYDFKLFPLYPFGNYTILAYVLVVGIAIVRYRFMDIEVVIKRTLVFAGLVGSVVAVVSLVAFISQDVLAKFVHVPRWLSNVFTASIIAGVYAPIRNWLVNTTDRYLFQKKYDYKQLLKKFTDEVMVVLNLKELVQMTVTTLSETVKLDGCSLLLLNKDARKYELVASKGANGQQLVLEESEPLVEFLRKTHEPIGQDGAPGQAQFPERIAQQFSQLHARLVLPLHLHDDLIGILCLGKKKSDEEFTKDDLDILLPLAKTLAIAVSNAQLFDELAKTQAEAAQKEKLAVIGTLSAGINHEICNPLGIVKAQCEAFLLDLEDGILIGKSPQEVLEKSSSIMRVALKQIDRATAITQKLSNFAKPVKQPTIQPVHVADEVDEVLLLVGHDLKLEKIEVEKDIQHGLPPIAVDRRQLQEVLFNIIRNAGQAITPPGVITIRASEQDAWVRIEISDTGAGIPADKLEKIYDPFFTTKDPGKGTGLGLFIVRQIVERNKGRILVESEVGKGTSFLLDFPAVPQPQPVQ